MDEVTEPGNQLPDRVYTVGDEIRLSVEIVTTEHPTNVTAVFRAEHNEDLTITMHDELTLDSLPEEAPQKISEKTYRADLVSLVDVDHQLGIYRLHMLQYSNPLTTSIGWAHPDVPTSFKSEATRFRIADPHEKGTAPPRVTARLVDPPDDE